MYDSSTGALKRSFVNPEPQDTTISVEVSIALRDDNVLIEALQDGDGPYDSGVAAPV